MYLNTYVRSKKDYEFFQRLQEIKKLNMDLDKIHKQIGVLNDTSPAFPIQEFVHDDIDIPGAEEPPQEGEDAREE